MTPAARPILQTLGDHALRVQFGLPDDPNTHRQVRAFARWLEHHAPDGVTDWVPAFHTVAVYYDPRRIAPGALRYRLRFGLAANAVADSVSPITRIAVRYGGADGPDLPEVAALHDLTVPEAIDAHCAPVYEVAMMGFLPGFAYLSGLPECLYAPRLDTPRTLVPAGSVAIGGLQTGIYPMASPGGWRIIGRTQAVLFDSNHTPPVLLQVGARVQFVPLH